MALNIDVGTNPVPLVLSVTTSGATRAAFNRRMRNFTTDSRAYLSSTGAATVYGVNHPGRISSPQRVFRFKGDGSTTSFTLPTAPSGVTYPTTNGASLTAANYLQAIALTLPDERGMEVDAVLTERVGSDASPTGTQWKINGTAVTVGTAIAAGKWLEIIIPDPALITQFTGGALTANVRVGVKMTDFVTTGVAAAYFEAVTRG